MNKYSKLIFVSLIFFVIGIFISFVTPASASAATLYVSSSTANGYVVGNDVNNGLSKSTPKLTFASADTAAANGDMIIVNDGTYSVGSSLTITKTYTVNSETDYGATLTASGTVFVFGISPASGGSVTFGKVIISGRSVTQNGIYLNAQATKYGLILNSTKIIDYTRFGVRGEAATNLDFTATNVILNSTVGGSGYPDIGIGPITAVTSLWVSGKAVITGTRITTTAAAGASNSIRLYGNTGVTASVRNNTITASSVSGGAAIDLKNIANAVIDNNTITISNTPSGSYDGIVVAAYSSTPADSSNAQISNNVIHNNGTGGHIIMVGTDGTGGATDNQANNATVYGNTLYGSSNSSTLHGIMIGSQSGGSVYNNRVTDTNISYLAKLTTGQTTFYNNEAIGLLGTPSVLFYAKGATGARFINNTGYITPTSGNNAQGIITFEDPTIPTYSSNILYQNNNLYFSVTPNWVARNYASNTATFYSNNYYFNGVTPGNGWAYNNTTYATFATWQAAQESTALSVDPLFANVTSNNFNLTSSSPVIDVGTNANCPTTDFSGTTRPQDGDNNGSAICDIGAYEYTYHVGSGSSNTFSSQSSSSCTSSKPESSPRLFQINATRGNATLFFSPSNNNTSSYVISYGYTSDDERFGVAFNYGSTNAAIKYTINQLESNKTYYFKVRGGNGCMPGDWSNTLKATTLPENNSLGTKIFTAWEQMKDVVQAWLKS
ncbi:hypothetical protein BH11PAT1_BH11PAT1_3970 [soil metagenome]